MVTRERSFCSTTYDDLAGVVETAVQCPHAMRVRRWLVWELAECPESPTSYMARWGEREIRGIEAEYGCDCWRWEIGMQAPEPVQHQIFLSDWMRLVILGIRERAAAGGGQDG